MLKQLFKDAKTIIIKKVFPNFFGHGTLCCITLATEYLVKKFVKTDLSSRNIIQFCTSLSRN